MGVSRASQVTFSNKVSGAVGYDLNSKQEGVQGEEMWQFTGVIFPKAFRDKFLHVAVARTRNLLDLS